MDHERAVFLINNYRRVIGYGPVAWRQRHDWHCQLGEQHAILFRLIVNVEMRCGTTMPARNPFRPQLGDPDPESRAHVFARVDRTDLQ
jgi:hypothetical protein